MIGIIALLISILLPSPEPGPRAGEPDQVRSNLRQLAMAGLIYASENKGKFPRTYYHAGRTHDDHKGGRDQPDRQRVQPHSPDGPVGKNNAAASFYLLLKNTDLTAEAFLCPSTDATRAYAGGGSGQGIQDFSNWPGDPRRAVQPRLVQLRLPFRNQRAERQMEVQLASSADWPFAADMNPGPGGTTADGGAAGRQT